VNDPPRTRTRRAGKAQASPSPVVPTLDTVVPFWESSDSRVELAPSIPGLDCSRSARASSRSSRSPCRSDLSASKPDQDDSRSPLTCSISDLARSISDRPRSRSSRSPSRSVVADAKPDRDGPISPRTCSIPDRACPRSLRAAQRSLLANPIPSLLKNGFGESCQNDETLSRSGGSAERRHFQRKDGRWERRHEGGALPRCRHGGMGVR